MGRPVAGRSIVFPDQRFVQARYRQRVWAQGPAPLQSGRRHRRGGTGDADGVPNGVVVAKRQVPADGRATGASLQLTAASGSQTAITTFSDAPNKIVSENQNAGTPKSVWAIHGSIANQGDSQI